MEMIQSSYYKSIFNIIYLQYIKVFLNYIIYLITI